jgi:hypothetical protein
MKSRIMLVASLGLIGCGDGKSSGLTAAASSETSTDSETAGSTDGDWSECLPQSVSNSPFVVGPDTPWGIYDPDINWPPGHHHAVCVVDWIPVNATQVSIQLRECQDDLAQPVALSLDLQFTSDVFIEAPPGIEVDRVVRVSYSVTEYEQATHDAWYSLRDAQTDELLLAAFSDFGPSVIPKIDGMIDLENWLAPFEATLGPFGCAPELEAACEGDDTPQRAFVEFTRYGATVNVLGGTEGDLGDYRVHLGFAGAPDACEGIPTHHAIEGIVIRKL